MGGLLWFLLAVAPGLPGYELPAISQDAYIQAVTGNGRLTAGVDGQGRLAQLRWPALGHWEHVTGGETDATGPSSGGHWLILEPDGATTVGGKGWHVSHTLQPTGDIFSRFEETAKGQRHAEQRLYVAPDSDALVIRLTLSGFPPETRCFWYQHLSPTTRLISGIPDGHLLPQIASGFGTFLDFQEEMVVQFRPYAPQRSDWAKARHLVQTQPAPSAWSSFSEGVYWGAFSLGGLVSMNVGPISTPPEEFIDGIQRSGHPGVVGDAHAAIEVRPVEADSENPRYTVCLVAGASYVEVSALRAAIADGGIPDATPFPLLPGNTNEPVIAPLLATLDGETGTIVRAPLSRPALAHAAVFDTAWATAALDEFSRHEEAWAALRFHLGTVRRSYTSDGAPGSLPAYVHTNGKPASLLDRANPATTAWLLAALWRHCLSNPPNAALSFFQDNLDAVVDCGDYLSRAPAVGGVLAGRTRPLSVSLTTLQTHYLGLVSACGILSTFDLEEPEHWQTRREEIYARIRFRQLNGGEAEEAGSAWIGLWISLLPGEALASEPGLALLNGSPVRPIEEIVETTDTGGMVVSPAVPVALRAALTALAR